MEKMVDNNMTGHVVIDAKDKRELIIEVLEKQDSKIRIHD